MLRGRDQRPRRWRPRTLFPAWGECCFVRLRVPGWSLVAGRLRWARPAKGRRRVLGRQGGVLWLLLGSDSRKAFFCGVWEVHSAVPGP